MFSSCDHVRPVQVDKPNASLPYLLLRKYETAQPCDFRNAADHVAYTYKGAQVALGSLKVRSIHFLLPLKRGFTQTRIKFPHESRAYNET